MDAKASFIWSWISLIAFFLLWELMAEFSLVPIELARPSVIILYLYATLLNGQLVSDVTASLWRILIGLAAGVVIGISFGLITGRSQLANRIIAPVINLIRSMPPVALLTVFVALMGSSDQMRVIAILFTAIFNVYINTHVGASTVPIEYIRNSKLLTRSKLKRMIRVVLPASMPFILSGIRLSVATAFIVAYVGETAGTSQGIGFQITDAQNSFQYPKMIGYLFVMGGLAAGTDQIIYWAATRFFPWLKLQPGQM